MTNGGQGASNSNTNPGKKLSLRLERVSGMLDDLEREIELRAKAVNVAQEPWVNEAKACLTSARQAITAKRREKAHRLCAQGYRMLIRGFSDEELRDRALVLRTEAHEKLVGWRNQAVEDLLGKPDPAKPVSAARLSLAQYVLDQHFDNVYFKLGVSADRYLWSGCALAVVAAALFGVSWWFQDPEKSELLRSPYRTGLVLLLGAAGALLSYILSVIAAKSKIPALIGTGQTLCIRPLLGAVSAVLVVIVCQSELLPIKAPTDSTLYAYAIAAGFTDQLLTRVMKAVEDSIGK